MKAKILIIGASGRVGSQLVKELDKNSDGVEVYLATSDLKTSETWLAEGRKTKVFDLNNPSSFPEALKGIDRVFLLTTYTSDMLFQGKMLVDAAVDAGVKHIVHLGVFTSRKDSIPHFSWHDLLESYIESKGVAWTHIHPNVITETILVQNPPISESRTFSVYWGEAKQGWVSTIDIAAVAAGVLREGPDKHNHQNYYLSIEVLTGPEVAEILTEVSGIEINCNALSPKDLKETLTQIPSAPMRAYMESAVITMELATAGKMTAQTVVRDDVLKVLGRPGTTMAQWARQYFGGLQNSPAGNQKPKTGNQKGNEELVKQLR